MNSLISKVQFNNFEPGEFIDEQERSYDETIALIDGFPWKIQREHIVIDLTNPSITIQGTQNDYLKIALFFEGKFVLHYVDANDTLFTKSFLWLKDSYPYIQHFFQEENVDLNDFKKETTWFKKSRLHFISQNFCYTSSPERLYKYILSTTGFNLSLGFLALLYVLFSKTNHLDLLGSVLVFIPLFFVSGGLHLLIIFNFYFHSKGKTLIMSKGNERILFGPDKNPESYYKKDIHSIVVKRSKGSPGRQSFIGAFSVTEILFNDGKLIRIPSIFIDHSTILMKLNGRDYDERNTIPWLRG